MTNTQRGTPPTNTTATALIQTPQGPLAVAKWGMTTDQVDLLKRTICRGSSDDEFALFMTVAQRMPRNGSRPAWSSHSWRST